MNLYVEAGKDSLKKSTRSTALDLEKLVLFLMNLFKIDTTDIVIKSLRQYLPLNESLVVNKELIFLVTSCPGYNYLGYFKKTGEETPSKVVHLHWNIGKDMYSASVYHVPNSDTIRIVPRIKPGLATGTGK